MVDIFVSIGSNIQREVHIVAGVKALREKYQQVICSPIYESVAVGFEGDNFYNLVAYFSTDLSLELVTNSLTEIENNNGRIRTDRKFSARTLDLDLLLYDDLIINSDTLVLPRPEIYQNAFVLKPLVDVAADRYDPVKGLSYGEIWSEFDQSEQALWLAELQIPNPRQKTTAN